ncbi:hypothetical protein ACSLVQ_27435, partial [Klebsiella pneumoniae]|uniref:hypothetical protein n=1 Tax=Klebsiella pneumoniae TaxID=573 RepID=UPI003EE1EAD4
PESLTLYDADQRLVMISQRTLDFEIPQVRDKIRLGMSFSDVIGAIWDAGYVPSDTPFTTREGFIEWRLGHFLEPPPPRLIQMGDSHMLIVERKTVDG